MYLVCVCAHYCMGIRGQFEKSQFFPPSMWVLESILRLSGLVPCFFTAESAHLPKCVILFITFIFCLPHKMNMPLKYEALQCDIIIEKTLQTHLGHVNQMLSPFTSPRISTTYSSIIATKYCSPCPNCRKHKLKYKSKLSLQIQIFFILFTINFTYFPDFTYLK